jgi:hypothetical protein
LFFAPYDYGMNTNQEYHAVSRFIGWLEEQGLTISRGAMPQRPVATLSEFIIDDQTRRAAKVAGASNAKD